ncbi:hypothetical protein [Mesorhizobium sp. dw_380]|uniref:hypothetical protein n=1 Tax=Mesorhizobium sp. dw_380 TaxID=2812001 RepID=UPI002032C0E4|nr:hypothetical protein [Mesorhizobium sp. dw_380]
MHHRLDGHATELAAAAATEQDKARLRAILAECERLAAIQDRTTRENSRSASTCIG